MVTNVINEKPPPGFKLLKTLEERLSLIDKIRRKLTVITAGRIDRITFSPDARMLAATGYGQPLRIWDTSTGDIQYIGERSRNRGTAWSPNSRLIAVIHSYDSITLWDVGTSQMIQEIEGVGGVEDLIFSPDSQTIAAPEEKIIKLLNTKTGEVRHLLRGHRNSIKSIAFSPDGQILASASEDETIRLWDADSGKLMRTLEGHSDSVLSIAWFPDGRILASSGADSTIRLWDSKTWREIGVLEGHTSSITKIAFVFEGNLLASFARFDRKPLRFWRCDTWDLISETERKELGSSYISEMAFHSDAPILAIAESDQLPVSL